MIPRCWLIAAAAALAMSAANTRAQAPRGSALLTSGAVAESLVVLRGLDSAVRANPNDAAAWHRLGIVAWVLAERDRHEPRVDGLDRTRLGRQADTSLRLAAALDPLNGYYGLMAGRYLLASGVSLTRAGSYQLFERGLEAARARGEPYAHSEAAIEAGRVYWRRYDTFANRALPFPGMPACDFGTGVFNPQIIAAGSERGKVVAQGVSVIRGELGQCLQEVTDRSSGAADYIRAEAHFREAFDALPSNQRAYRQLAMLLVEGERWPELAALARTRLANAPWDAWAWLTLGLALHRKDQNGRAAAAAYDSAFTLLPPEEIRRFHHLQRVLSPTDSGRLSFTDPARKFATYRLYWLAAIDLWSQTERTPQLEFLSRITHAELRWTVEELNVRGADTDRGDVFIRYGPPDLIVSRGGATGGVITTWAYHMGLVFTFEGQATFATARVPQDDRQVFDEIVNVAPVRWGNIREVRVDSMPTQVARFRGAGDSVDVLFAALPPVDSIRRASEVNGFVRTDFWLLAGGTVMVIRDSIPVTRRGVQVFTHRVAPRSYLYRIEASAEASTLAARASASVGTGASAEHGDFASSGFGMSDVVVGLTAGNRVPAPRRWRDLNIAPLVGATDSLAQLALVWENYDLANDNGAARYVVTVSLRREVGTRSRVAARIVGALASRVGISESDEGVTLTFDRAMPHTSIVLENVTMSLGGTAPGNYELTIEITDQVSGRKASRSTFITVQ